MPFDEPPWWYASAKSAIPTLLRPVASLWSFAAVRRMRAATPYRSRLPVVCIGNFTAGGTGKTPMTALVVAELHALGLRPVVLTRGYGGRLRGPHLVDPSRDTARDVGDEPLLHAAHGPVMVARDRAAGARAIEALDGAGHVIVMDDGLQNPSLSKHLTIAVVDARRGIGNGHVIPSGPLRAPLAFQLARAQAIVVNGGEAGGTAAVPKPEFISGFPGRVLSATVTPAADTGWLQGSRVVAWAGIGAPQRFFNLLGRLGANIVETIEFRDHQELSEADAASLLAMARRNRALLVTTEKDWVRLSGSAGARAALQQDSRRLPIALRMPDHDIRTLRALLTAAVNSSANREG